MKPADPRTGKLLRWYPRAWRERYGEEFVALIQDTLDGRRPTWRLRLSVARAGLRERWYQVARTAKAATERPSASRWLTSAVIGGIVALVPANLKASLAPARAWQGTAALDALLAVAAFTCAAVLAGTLIALPAFVRFLQAGGWPKVRRRIAWAAGATGAGGGGLVGLLLAQRSMTHAQLSQSPGYWAADLAASLALVVALGLWVSTVTGLRKDLKLAPRVRAAEVVLGAVIATATWASVDAYFIWYHTVQLSVPWLLLWTALLASTGVTGSRSVRRAVRRSRRILAAAGRGR
jgi:hypothetical protein